MLGPNTLAPGPMMPTPRNPRLRRVRRLLAAIGLIFVAVLAPVLVRKPLLIGFAYLFRVNDPAPSDALVLMLGGPGHRPQKAAELFRAGLAPIVLLGESGVDQQSGSSETTRTYQILLQNGVPAQSIQILPGVVTSTQEEARRVLDYVRSHPYVRRITIVTTAFHTARTRWIFRKVLKGTGVDVRLAAARSPDFDESDWFAKEDGLVMYFSETIKAVYYRLVY